MISCDKDERYEEYSVNWNARSWKSTIGVILAKELGYQFVDADLLIQKQEKRLLKEIISEEGIEGFIAIENKVNASIEANRTVIATGGSVVYGREAMEHLGEIATFERKVMDSKKISEIVLQSSEKTAGQPEKPWSGFAGRTDIKRFI